MPPVKMPVRTAEVNILYVNPPDKKPEWGSIKVDPPVEGREYLDVWHQNITEFDTGPAIVSYTTKEAREGPPWVTARRMTPLNKRPEVGNGGLRAAPGKPGAMGGEKDRLISLLALLKPMLESGKAPTPDDAKMMCDRAISMYEYMRQSYNPQHADDMDDEVPL